MKATVTPDNHLLLGRYTDEHLWMHVLKLMGYRKLGLWVTPAHTNWTTKD